MLCWRLSEFRRFAGSCVGWRLCWRLGRRLGWMLVWAADWDVLDNEKG
jgi:hypothetical protein